MMKNILKQELKSKNKTKQKVKRKQINRSYLKKFQLKLKPSWINCLSYTAISKNVAWQIDGPGGNQQKAEFSLLRKRD